jgi:hypothetical protein
VELPIEQVCSSKEESPDAHKNPVLNIMDVESAKGETGNAKKQKPEGAWVAVGTSAEKEAH